MKGRDIAALAFMFVMFMPPGCIGKGGVNESGFFPKDSVVVGLWKIIDREANRP